MKVDQIKFTYEVSQIKKLVKLEELPGAFKRPPMRAYRIKFYLDIDKQVKTRLVSQILQIMKENEERNLKAEAFKEILGEMHYNQGLKWHLEGSLPPYPGHYPLYPGYAYEQIFFFLPVQYIRGERYVDCTVYNMEEIDKLEKEREFHRNLYNKYFYSLMNEFQKLPKILSEQMETFLGGFKEDMLFIITLIATLKDEFAQIGLDEQSIFNLLLNELEFYYNKEVNYEGVEKVEPFLRPALINDLVTQLVFGFDKDSGKFIYSFGEERKKIVRDIQDNTGLVRNFILIKLNQLCLKDGSPWFIQEDLVKELIDSYGLNRAEIEGSIEELFKKPAWDFKGYMKERRGEYILKEKRMKGPDIFITYNQKLVQSLLFKLVNDYLFFDNLIEQLESKDETIKIHAIIKLGELGDQRAIEPLVSCFTNANALLQDRIRKVLIKIGGEEVLQRLKEIYEKSLRERIEIFISYAMADSKRLQIPEIARKLANKSFKIKVHYWEGWSGYPDGNIIEFMEKNIVSSTFFIPICTEAMLKSENCKKERDLASYYNKKIIPVFEFIEFVPPIFQPKIGINMNSKKIIQIVDEIYVQIEAQS
ncbi:MAG: TIR domain-containing protein [Candidatus Helarchaeota archaeon]